MFKDWFNWKVAEGIIRQLAQAIAGYLVTAGAVTQDTAQLIPGAILGIAAVIWSIVAAHQAKKALVTVEAVKKIVPHFDPAHDVIVPAKQTDEPGVQVSVKRSPFNDPTLEAGRK